jgi:hypothetical protein
MTETTAPIPRRVRVGTIVWGAILVAVAIFAILVLFFGPLGPGAILWTVIGFGSILVLGAIAAGIVRAVRPRPTPVAAEALSEAPSEAPIEAPIEATAPTEVL